MRKQIASILICLLSVSVLSACGTGSKNSSIDTGDVSQANTEEAAEDLQVASEEAAEDLQVAGEDVNDNTSEEPLVNAEDFYGCWEYENYYCWLCINEDGSFVWYSADGTGTSGEYYIDGESLYEVEDDFSYSLDGEGGLIDQDGDALFQSELPDVWPLDFCGCWEYENYYVWLCINEDGSLVLYYGDGTSKNWNYYVENGTLYVVGADASFTLDGEGGMVDNDGEALFQSELPDVWPGQ